MRKNVFLLYKEPKEQQYEIKYILKSPYFSPLSCKSVCPNFLAVLFPVIPAEAGIQRCGLPATDKGLFTTA